MHVVAPGPVGGLERVVEALATGTAQAGHEVAVAAVVDQLTSGPGWLDRLALAGVRVARLPLPPRAYLQERRELAQLIAALAPAVVHTHGYRPDVQAGRVARRLGCATVATVHGFTGGGRKNRLYEWLQLRALREHDAVVAVAQSVVDRLTAAGVPPERIHLILNAAPPDRSPMSRADARRQLALPESEFVLGWVGRLSQEKGADLAIAALARLGPGPPTLAVLGEGRERSALERMAADLGVGDRIRWCGTIPDAGRVFAAFDCYVLSSRTEGTPIVLFEAMAAAVPIVATAVGGVPDVLSDREAVLVATPDAGALAAAIRTVRSDPAAAQARALAARRRLAEERGIEPWVARYETVYRHVLHPHPTRPA